VALLEYFTDFRQESPAAMQKRKIIQFSDCSA
jgi:hypothetical protein